MKYPTPLASGIRKSWYGKHLVWWWPVRSLDGDILGYSVRYDPRDPEGKKEVIPYFKRNRERWCSGGLPAPRPLFGLHSLNGHISVVYVTEGEKKAAALHSLGLAAVSSLGGAQAPHLADWEPLDDFLMVILLPDNDGPGEDYVRVVGGILRDRNATRGIHVSRLPDLGVGGDVVDWLKSLLPDWDGFSPILREPGDDLSAQLVETIEAHSETIPEDWVMETEKLTESGIGPIQPRKLECLCVADVEPEEVTWLWQGRFPMGKLVMLDGDPSVGKSTISIDIAARMTTGKPFPGETLARAPVNVLFLTAEDGIADTVRPRLDASGADVSRAFCIQPDDMPSFPKDLSGIRDLVKLHTIGLVVIDPIMAYLDGRVDSHRDQDVRRVLSGLAALASETSATILVIRHLNKNASMSALYRGAGSIAFIGACRVGLLAVKSHDEDGRFVLAVTKCNLAKIAPSLFYRLIQPDGSAMTRVEWQGEAPYTADDLVREAASNGTETKAERAADFLREQLKDGPVPASEMKARAAQAGFSEPTINRVKRSIGVDSVPTGNPKQPGQWLWALPR